MAIRPPTIRPRPAPGLALVEFVLIAPVLLLLLLAVAEMGRALYQYNTLTKAVYAGARYYAANVLVNADEANAKAILLVQYGNETGAGEPLLPPPLPDVFPEYFPDSEARVSANYTFTLLPGDPLSGILILLGGAGVPTPFVLTSTVTLRPI